MTLDKWHSKIQLTSAGSASKFKQTLQTPSAQIQEQLKDMPRLKERFQIKRTDHTKTVDRNTFDDAEFYQSLLREMIDRRSGKDAMQSTLDQAIQPKRVKVKRIVDTKASKGRKIRYTPHPKLQAFMVPIPHTSEQWHEEQIDELFKTLLGETRQLSPSKVRVVDPVVKSLDVDM